MATKDFPLRTIVRDIAFCCHSKMEKKKNRYFEKETIVSQTSNE